MSNSIVQAYTDYLVSVNKMIYNTSVDLVKTTQDFAAEAAKLNPYKDAFGFMDRAANSK
jgi:hypothetical protein